MSLMGLLGDINLTPLERSYYLCKSELYMSQRDVHILAISLVLIIAWILFLNILDFIMRSENRKKVKK